MSEQKSTAHANRKISRRNKARPTGVAQEIPKAKNRKIGRHNKPWPIGIAQENPEAKIGNRRNICECRSRNAAPCRTLPPRFIQGVRGG